MIVFTFRAKIETDLEDIKGNSNDGIWEENILNIVVQLIPEIFYSISALVWFNISWQEVCDILVDRAEPLVLWAACAVIAANPPNMGLASSSIISAVMEE
jgi:hypothetical protein